MRRYADYHAEFESLLVELTNQWGRDFHQGFIQNLLAKIEVLEEWAINGMPERQVDKFILNLKFFNNWVDEDLKVERLNTVSSTTTHPRYGLFVRHADKLLRGLRTQCRQRDLLPGRRANGPSSFKAHVLRPGTFGPMLCPNQDELTAFLAHLGLMCKIDYASLRGLRRNCLIGSANGKVGIQYVKKRPSPATKVDWVRDGSIETPGGLIRRVLELTEVAHNALKQAGHPDADDLWLGYFPRGSSRNAVFLTLSVTLGGYSPTAIT